MRILLVDGDVAANHTFCRALATEGFRVESAATAAEGLSLVRHYEFDLALINLSLPDMEGAALIARMRSAKRDTPVLALTQAASTEVRLRALAAGADDVVHRQTDLRELIARMNAIIRRSRGYSQSVLHIGAISLNADAGTVSADDIPVGLTQKEFCVLKTLMLRRNVVMTKSALLSALYDGMDEPEAKIIDVFVCKIRKKFAKVGLNDVIGTVWSRGYVVTDNAGDRNSPQPEIIQPMQPSYRLAHA